MVIYCHNISMNSSVGTLPTPSTYTRILLQRLPAQAPALLAGTGLTKETVLHMPTITVAQQLQVFRNAKLVVNRADWALDFGKQLNINSHGPLGFAALSAPTLGEGMEVLGRFARIRAPNLSFQTRQSENRLFFEIDTGLWPQEDLAPSIVEIVLQITAAYVEAVIGHQVAQATLMFMSPPPPHAALYADYFHARCEFNAPVNAYVLAANLGSLPCPLHDEKSYRTALIRCRETLDALLGPDDVVTRVRHLLASHFDQLSTGGEARTLPQLGDLANALCVSQRTLIRQLAAQGSSFRQLLEEEQRDVAGKLLAQARYSIGEIGVLLGYGDAANFGRAFRRMYGVSPGQYRRRPV